MSDSDLRLMRYMHIQSGLSCSMNSKEGKWAPHLHRLLHIWTLNENRLVPLL